MTTATMRLTWLVLALLVSMTCRAWEVRMPSGEYFESVEDLRVKVLGGHVRLIRSWSGGQWQFNTPWTRLKFAFDNLDGGVTSIDRAGVVYRKSATGVYALGVEALIRVTPTGYRWEDRRGNWIAYDQQGKLLAYADRNDVTVSLEYDATGNLARALDHFGNPAVIFEYAGGNLTAAQDRAGRRVSYRYSGKLLIETTDTTDSVWKYGYDSGGRLVSVTDPEGRARTIGYGTAGRVSELKEADGARTQYGYDYDSARREYYVQVRTPTDRLEEAWYDSAGIEKRRQVNGVQISGASLEQRARTFTQANGHLVAESLDEWGNIVRRTYPDDSVETWAYEPRFLNPVLHTGATGATTTHEYDEKGNLTRTVEAAGRPEERVILQTFDQYGQLTSVALQGRGEAPVRVIYEYDAFGNRTKTTDPLGNAARYAHDVEGKIVELVDRRGQTWTNTYDRAGRLAASRNPLGQGQAYEYDKVGNLVASIDPAGSRTEYEYDVRDRLVKEIDALGHVFRQEFDAEGQLTLQLSPTGAAVRYEYDAFGRLLRLVDGGGNALHYEYQPASGPDGGSRKPIKVVFPTFERQLQYDQRDRLTRVTDSSGDEQPRSNQYQYDSEGRRVVATDPYGNFRGFEYDALGRITKLSDKEGGTTSLSYNGRGRLISLTDARGKTHQFVYDAGDRLIEEIRPSGRSTAYQYDTGGKLIRITDPLGQRRVFSYDTAGRLVGEQQYRSQEDTPARTIRFQYDAVGNMVSWSDDAHNATYSYDALGRKISETVQIGPLTLRYQYAYYGDGRKKSLTMPDGTTYTYAYAADGTLASVEIPGEGLLTVAGSTANRPARVSLPGGTVRHLSYTPFLQPDSMRVADPADRTLLQFNVTYGDLDELKTSELQGRLTTFGYDREIRLLSEQSPSGERTYSLDAISNRTSSPPPAGSWVYDDDGRLTSTPDGSLEYDDNGSLSAYARASGKLVYESDPANQLVAVTDGNGNTVARYGYDPFGRRIYKEAAGALTLFLYADEGLLAEYNSTGVQVAAYGWVPDGPWGSGPLFIRSDSSYFYSHNDRLGTPLALTDKRGTVVWSAQYTAFGEAVVDPGSTVRNNLRLPGQYFDAETNLHYNFRRYYDPSLGRYTSEDPVGMLAGPNLYAYAEHSPGNHVDPTGEFVGPVGQGAATGARVGATVGTFIEPGGGTAVGAVVGAIVGAAIVGATIWYLTDDDASDDSDTDPGDCTKQQHRALQDEVNRLCKKIPRACKGNQDCDTLRDNYNNTQRCIDAREDVMNTCYKGGDQRHRDAVDNERRALDKCREWMKRKNCDPCP